MSMRRTVAEATRALSHVARALLRRRETGTSSARSATDGRHGDAAEPAVEERDALGILTAEHRELDSWLSRLEDEPGSPDTPELVERIRTQLHAHVWIEEHAFYPHLREEVGSNLGGLLDTSDGRHSTIGQLLALFEETDPADAVGIRKVASALRHEFDDDVRLEEDSIFPQARLALTRQRLIALGRMLDEERQSQLASG